LALAESHGLRTIAFPSISTGAYGFPIALASRIALREMTQFLRGNISLAEVSVITFSGADFRTYTDALAELEAGNNDH
jgi:O-acetyl-ADP-ribose deacetylase (regulator of RNase III)